MNVSLLIFSILLIYIFGLFARDTFWGMTIIFLSLSCWRFELRTYDDALEDELFTDLLLDEVLTSPALNDEILGYMCEYLWLLEDLDLESLFKFSEYFDEIDCLTVLYRFIFNSFLISFFKFECTSSGKGSYWMTSSISGMSSGSSLGTLSIDE